MADMDELKSKVKTMLVERLMLDISPEEIGDDQALIDTLDLDSIRLFELVVGAEEEFDVSFEDDEFSVQGFNTVNSITAIIQGKLES